jgi:membrane dipeptidase
VRCVFVPKPLMTFLIDAHEDLAYNALTFQRDYRRSAYETRKIEAGTPQEQAAGGCLLGWPEYQQGQVALAIGSLFTVPQKYLMGNWENQNYASDEQAIRLIHGQIDFYRRLTDQSPDLFRLVRTRGDLEALLAPWDQAPASPPERVLPVGLIMSIEGAEGVSSQREVEAFWEAGTRLIGPVWAGTRFCGGTMEGERFTREGLHLLEWMAELGYTLDIAHMNEESALEALDRYPGTIIASHANASALLDGRERAVRRHLSDRVILKLSERGGVIGVLPYNRFLAPDWTVNDPREQIPLRMLVNHIDHICQVTGSSRNVAIGTDFDGGFGWPSVPLEINTIADVQKLEPILLESGFDHDNIRAIFHENWRRILENSLPE